MLSGCETSRRLKNPCPCASALPSSFPDNTGWIIKWNVRRHPRRAVKPSEPVFVWTVLPSRAMAIRVVRSLTSIVKEAKRLGHVAKNVCEDVKVQRKAREKEKVVPPTKEQIRALLKAADAMGNSRPMAKPMLMVFVYAGLRASELRALPWRNVNLAKGTITIDQRADRKNVIGAPKSAAGRRTIPLPPSAVAELKKWKLRCPTTDLDLVFPSEAGTPIFWPNLVLGFQEPLQIAAGVTAPKTTRGKPVLDDKGKPVLAGLYGLHSFRHAAASLWIEQRVPAKRVQTWMGHSSIQVTFDTYGHLFAALDDDSAVMAAMEAGVMGVEEAA